MHTDIIVGVMGPGAGATAEDKAVAYELGQNIAEQSWTLLTGGRKAGVMDAAMKGARDADGKTVGILPGTNETGMSEHVQIPIFTGMGHARNAINIHSSRLIFACGLGAGTSSEISLALKTGTPTILLKQSRETLEYFQQLTPELVSKAQDASHAIELAQVHI